jgi:putative tricarboxylic transport membrane protein
VTDQLLAGLFHVLEWQYILAMTIGLIAGILVGAIPGLTASIGISLLIPLTYGMDPLFALAMMAGIHNGGSAGGAIPAILLNIPGTPAAVATAFDGYPMTKQGRALTALKLAAASSAVGGALGAIVLLFLAPPLATATLAFGPPEIFWANVFGMCAVAVLLGDDPLKGLLSLTIGLMIGVVGIDFVSGYQRFTFGVLELTEGFSLLVVLVGMYALPPAWQIIEQGAANRKKGFSDVLRPDPTYRWPWRKLLLNVWPRASLIGIAFGLLPGVSGSASSFVAYNDTRNSSNEPETFGKGNPLGVASAEASNNSDNAASMIPALTLGIPGSGVAALMLGALVIHGMLPGAHLFVEQGPVVYGYMWAMLFTSIAIVVFGGLIATKIFAQVLLVPSLLLMPMIVSLTFIGIYTFKNEIFNVYFMLGFGVLGYLLNRLKFPVAPIVIGLILGDKAQESLRTKLQLSHGDFGILFTRPISLTIFILIVLVLIYPIWQTLKAKRQD